ncbi:hypothetical protein BOTBODRAFT_457264 [Botryobasidium botryosum FD-172 SS1]|uniref:Uncharacterized protein n=1 Tax=Botryobasidium botryosum (strain FD-172 SS1) TaxID=930990 RepID=A0A067MHB5_BOTB1|nr:hypothetical protein BOTBODRAFT_457264 [Botryobasidium botryosum FD-172 SS1]
MGEWVRENGGESETMGEGVSVSTNAGEACGYAYDPVLFICASHCCCCECVPAVLLSPMRARRAQSWVGVWPVRTAVVCRLSFVVRRPSSVAVVRRLSFVICGRHSSCSSPVVAVCSCSTPRVRAFVRLSFAVADVVTVRSPLAPRRLLSASTHLRCDRSPFACYVTMYLSTSLLALAAPSRPSFIASRYERECEYRKR